MPTAINNRNLENSARDWIMTLLDCVGFPTSNVLRRKRGESQPKPPRQQFDDMHHWDLTAEEWVPNDPT
jgi:hypothetical protein